MKNKSGVGQNENLESVINQKDHEIKHLRAEISLLKESKPDEKPNGFSPGSPVATLTEELQNKLNKARTRIDFLEQKLKEAQETTTSVPENKDKIELLEELKIKEEKINNLQTRMSIIESNLQSKEQELNSLKATLKNIINEKPSASKNSPKIEED